MLGQWKVYVEPIYSPARTDTPDGQSNLQAQFSHCHQPLMELTELGTRCSPASLAVWRRTAIKYWGLSDS